MKKFFHLVCLKQKIFVGAVCLLCPFLLPDVFSQPAEDSLLVDRSIQGIKRYYYDNLKENLRLYNGIEYEYFGRGSRGTPFFISDTIYNGDVFYDGNVYEGVPLRYDMVNDALLLKHQKDNNTIKLIENKVLYFTLLGHKFIRFANEQSNEGFSGFYELLYSDDKVLAFAKRFKKLLYSLDQDDKGGTFVQYNQYYVFKDEKYYSITSQRDIGRVFRDKKAAVNIFLKSQRKQIKNLEQALTAAARFYKGLSK